MHCMTASVMQSRWQRPCSACKGGAAIPAMSAFDQTGCRTSGAAQAKVKALLLDRCVLDRMLAKPTSCTTRAGVSPYGDLTQAGALLLHCT